MCLVDVNHDLDEVCLSPNYFVKKYKVSLAHNKQEVQKYRQKKINCAKKEAKTVKKHLA